MNALHSKLTPFCILSTVLSLAFLVLPPGVFAQTPFTISVYPNRIILGTKSGSMDQIIVSVLAGEGFNGTVNLSVTGVPKDVTATLRDYGAYLRPLTTFTTYLEITISPAAAFGNYTLTVAATSQEASVFYAAVSRVDLTIQENGHPSMSVENRTSTLTSVMEEFAIPLLVAVLLAGIALGSISTYIFTRKRKEEESEMSRALSMHTLKSQLKLTPLTENKTVSLGGSVVVA